MNDSLRIFLIIILFSSSFTSANLFFEGNLAYGHANAPVISSAITSATNEITVTFSSTHNINQTSVSSIRFFHIR